MTWVAVLLVSILFIYAVVSFAFYQEEFNDPDSNIFCGSLGECFITVLRFGLIDSFLVTYNSYTIVPIDLFLAHAIIEGGIV